MPLDLRDDESVRRGVKGILAREGRIDALINNAGVALGGAIEDTSIEEAKELFEGAGFPLLRPEDIARAVLLAARSDETGQVWAVQPGREPLKFRFPNVPGPRDPAGATVGLPPPGTS